MNRELVIWQLAVAEMNAGGYIEKWVCVDPRVLYDIAQKLCVDYQKQEVVFYFGAIDVANIPRIFSSVKGEICKLRNFLSQLSYFAAVEDLGEYEEFLSGKSWKKLRHSAIPLGPIERERKIAGVEPVSLWEYKNTKYTMFGNGLMHRKFE